MSSHAAPRVNLVEARRTAGTWPGMRALVKSACRVVPPLRRVLDRLDYYRQFERFCPLGHFYSPVPAPDATPFEPASPPMDGLAGIDLNHERQLQTLRQMAASFPEMPFQDLAQPGLRYQFQNPFFTYADASLLYGLLRLLRPRRMIEIGSGWSSAVTLDTNERFLDNAMRCTFVDPDPSRLVSLLKPGDVERLQIIPDRVQQIDRSLFDELGDGDVLFVDSSHVTKVGSDVNFLLFEVFPRLAPGVHVHVHDVFYPFEYPREWITGGRGWNEAYLIRAFLQDNRAWEITCFGHYLQHACPAELRQSMPLAMRSTAQSLWLKKVI